MSVFSKIIAALLVVLSVLYIKDKFFDGYNFDFFNKNKEQIQEVIPKDAEVVKEEAKKQPVEKKAEVVSVYFLTTSADGTAVFKKVNRKCKSKNKLNYAIKELLRGPNSIEKASGVYNEIPRGTELIGIQEQGNNIIINLSSDFQYGGGTDSIYTRMRQLIKTVLSNVSGKNIYLYLDGKQADVIGGDGIMVSQPLSENSLDD